MMPNANNPLQVVWVRNSSNGEYFDLLRLDLTAPYFTVKKVGVYVIWHTSPQGGRVVKVGQSTDIGERLKAHRLDNRITQYATYGALKVTWILLDPSFLDGVEAYLHNIYRPLVWERQPVAQPIPVVSLPNI